ncbi:MAG: TRAP transporter large permease [Methylobacteriaceae bacterium]|jgi:C4-dicarboxylate transporter DctM subunit|nr:TRAP transporter large permease [Methylobacteriaceae bacterium]
MSESMLPVVLFSLFLITLVVGIPISFSLGISSLICLYALDVPLTVVPQRLFTAMDSFPLMAIPFFILSGNLMTEGGISKRLLEFASAILGNIRGSIAMACILACAFFAALSGSGPATVVAIGSMVYPELIARGYPAEKMAGMIAVSGGLGPIIPPSIIMVIYCTITDNSIRALFAAGFSVGTIFAAGLIAVTYILAVIENWPVTGKKFSFGFAFAAFRHAVFALLMPVIILGGIYGGIFTPTEAAAVSVGYAYIVSVHIYRNLRIKDCCDIMYKSAISSAVILFIIATSNIFSWLFAYGGITDTLVNSISSLGLGYWGILLLLSTILLIFGLFLEGTAIIILLMPIFYPLAMNVGIDPIHFGIVVCTSIVIGTFTPPVAVNVFAAATFSKLSVEEIARGEIAWLAAMVVMLLIIIVFPELSLWPVRML